RIPLELVLAPAQLSWQHSLLIEVNFGLENSAFKSHLLILMAEEGIDALRDALDRLMETI
ncbi:MAG: chemotaxis protein CheC, partial [Halothiobacillaceae bacterium]